jgi:hypothetical protein
MSTSKVEDMSWQFDTLSGVGHELSFALPLQISRLQGRLEGGKAHGVPKRITPLTGWITVGYPRSLEGGCGVSVHTGIQA